MMELLPVVRRSGWSWFSRWANDGTWQRILTTLHCEADAAGTLDWTVSVDATAVRAHQHAAGAKGGARRHSADPAAG